jgi:Ca-activated chloride channel family protein
VRCTAVLFALFTGITAAAQQPDAVVQTSPTFRAAVELTVVLVSVTDRDNRSVAGLTRDDFLLLENGAPQPVAQFLSAEGGVDVALLVDISGSIQPVIGDLRRTATDFVDALRRGDRVMLIGFDHRVRPLCQLTDDRQELEHAVGRLRPSGSTSLFDSLYITVKTLAATTSDFTRRKAIVVISDGEDTSSILQPQEVWEQARRYGVPIYMILLNQGTVDVRDRFGSYEDKRRQYELKSIPRQTGGSTFVVAEGHSLNDAYRSIMEALSEQYVLAYEPARVNGGAEITVQIPSQPQAIVKTHTGREGTRTGG